MTARPPQIRDPIGRRLRLRLLAMWVGSILGVLLLVGVVLAMLIRDVRERETRHSVTDAVTMLRQELIHIAAGLLRQADLLAADAQVVTTIAMIHRYQDLSAYEPLVFDGEKQDLARTLATRLRTAGLHFAAIHDGDGRAAAWAGLGADGTPVPGYHTVLDGTEAMLSLDDGGWIPVPPPPHLHRGDWLRQVTEGDVTYRMVAGLVTLDIVVPVIRTLPGGQVANVGYVHLARAVDGAAMDTVAHRAGTGVALLASGRQVGTLPPLEVPQGLDLPDMTGPSICPCAWFKAAGLEVGATSFELDDASRVVFLAGLSVAAVDPILEYYSQAAIVAVLAVFLLVLPAGLLVLDRLLVRPLTRLLDGVEALRHGRTETLAGEFRDDEFGTLARGFDAMAASIAEREDSLKATIDKLAEANAELERYAVIAAHDLQEPLRLVASYSQLLKRRYHGRLDAEADEIIGFAVEGAERMQGLIRDLLDYARVDTIPAMNEAVDCAALVTGVLALLDEVVRDSGARITVEPLPTVRGNARQLGQVFQNLVSNALKFRDGVPEIRIWAERRGESWDFAVADNGIGIPPDYLPQLFTLFRRLHTRREYPGNGLGLAIAKRVVERHGGRIEAESVEGQGTTIRFTLPA
ncbi:ATP-binding protein [Magnetospirillum sp. UT-4]|uniref:ATP-binding protein n=1 Tax=Magnetospirillum sp. UT-4 TaxID=2681467 RepID=UPI0013845E0F|nr:ATP-binding protein [Magnetospirillum sp. UT-4]CAA7627044.1 putative Histidine kinase [Magnetospirillum sp. UT-4]